MTLAGRASRTTNKSSAIYARWKSWARDHNLPALYSCHLMADAKTASPIESAVYGIAWVYLLVGERSPSEHPLVKDVFAGAQRLWGNRASKKEPNTVAQLEQLSNSKALSMASLYDIRSVLIRLQAFPASFRFDELVKLVCSDVELDSEKLQLVIESSKTGKYRDGA